MLLKRPPNNLRRLAAIDIFFLGYRLIVGEYVCGALFSTALGVFILIRGHSLWQATLGTYLICLGINYIPMIICALEIRSRTRAQAEIADELADGKAAMAKYRAVSLLLLVPLATMFIAAGHALRSGRPGGES
jgi:hypothetical protein